MSDDRFIMGRDDVNYSLYVAQCPTTKRYLYKVKSFLMGEQAWMKAKNPTVEEVKEQLAFIASRRSIWVDDINEAELWDPYYQKLYGQYLPPVEFVKVTITAQ